jgi:glutamyl-tRNA reductase
VLLCVTANHRNTPFEALERLAVDAVALAQRVREDADDVRGAVAVATCNRVELYLEIDAPPIRAHAIARESFRRALTGLAGVEAATATHQAELLDDAAAVRHLFSVCAGLESVVVGEEEIVGQVRRAAIAARENGTSSGRLDHVVQEAIRTARRARAHGDASRPGRSLARLALDLVGTRLADWGSTRVLLVGTGRYAATTVASLRERGARDITVYSPTGRAQHFAARMHLDPTNDLPAALAASDVVITCTTRLSVGVDDVPPETRALIVDLGLPRNVDPAVGALDGIALLDLETIRLHAPLVHWSAEEDARAIVDSAAHAYATANAVEPAIVALREHVLGLVEAEIARARARDDDGRIEEALRHLTSVLLHTPSTLARRHAAAGRADQVVAAVQTLYGLKLSAREPTNSAAESSAQSEVLSSRASRARP